MINKRGIRVHNLLFNRKMLNSKHSQSQIVSSVLLILLVVAAIVLIFAFVIPFIKDRLNSGDCLDVTGKVEISTGYTCYNDETSGNEVMQVQINVGNVKDLIEGFSIELGGASTNNYEIKNNIKVTDVIMCGGSNDILELPPNDNTERTYVISSSEKPNIVRVYPILKGGKVCGVSDSVTTIDNCYGDKKCV